MVDESDQRKMVERSKRIIMQATESDYETAAAAFEEADQNVKLAIVMLLTDSTKDEAQAKLATAQGFVKTALEEKSNGKRNTDGRRISGEDFQEAGGMDNVETVNHCMTRVRMTVRDHDKVDQQGLRDSRCDGCGQ